MNKLVPLNISKEDIYAVESGEEIKYRRVNGNDIIDRYFSVQSKIKELGKEITIYTVRKVCYKDGLTKGLSNENIVENKYMYTTDTFNDHIYEAIKVLKKNGYILLYPKRTNK